MTGERWYTVMCAASAHSPDDPFAPSALAVAWARVRANGGAAGHDGVTVDTFGRDLHRRLRGLADDLRAGTYRPGGLRRVCLSKPNGGERVLAIPNVRDRVVQASVARLLSQRFDARMAQGSFGYRPERGVAGALAALNSARRAGLTWTLDADIKAFFDEVPHAQLMSDLSIWVEETSILRVVERWLAGFGPRRRGLAQGSPVSPVLANLYLHPLDQAMDRKSFRLIRYADDFVVPAASEAKAEAARRLAVFVLKQRGLCLHPDKTRVRRPGESFAFLGQVIVPAVAPGKRRRSP